MDALLIVGIGLFSIFLSVFLVVRFITKCIARHFYKKHVRQLMLSLERCNKGDKVMLFLTTEFIEYVRSLQQKRYNFFLSTRSQRLTISYISYELEKEYGQLFYPRCWEKEGSGIISKPLPDFS